jgi:hypothetical protein
VQFFMTPIVMLVGPGRSGKDTAGAAIARELGGVCIGLADPIKRFFALCGLSREQLWGREKEAMFTFDAPWVDDCMVRLSRAVEGWQTPAELSSLPFGNWLRALPERTTPRHLMQTFGTECVRTARPNFWIEHGLWVADRVLGGGWRYTNEGGLEVDKKMFFDVAVLTDGRFRNEALPVKRAGGVLLKVARTGAAVQAGFSEAAKQHISETEQGSIPEWWFASIIENDGTLEDFEAKAIRTAWHCLPG